MSCERHGNAYFRQEETYFIMMERKYDGRHEIYTYISTIQTSESYVCTIRTFLPKGSALSTKDQRSTSFFFLPSLDVFDSFFEDLADGVINDEEFQITLFILSRPSFAICLNTNVRRTIDRWLKIYSPRKDAKNQSLPPPPFPAVVQKIWAVRYR